MNPLDVLCPAITCLARPGQKCRDMGKPYDYIHPQRIDNLTRENQRRVSTFYDFSGGMESAAMLWIERERIEEVRAVVRWADTGKQFPEMHDSIRQIESILNIPIVVVPRRITFDEFLFERGGMIRKGTIDCSKRMKRANLSRHMKTFPRPYEINIGFNFGERDRAEKFTDLNERPYLHWRYPLIENRISRPMTKEICKEAGFTILVEMYLKMGRFDCFMCGNQSPRQALRVVDHYPELAAEWMQMEEKKCHSFMPIPLRVLVQERDRQGLLDFSGAECSCFGGDERFDEGEE